MVLDSKTMIKQLPLFSVLFFLSFGLSQNKININDLISYKDRFFKKNDDHPFTGFVFDINKRTGIQVFSYGMNNGIKNGLYSEFFSNGNKKIEGAYKEGREYGQWIEWHENGQKWYEGTYKDGKRDELWTYWYENGQKWYEITYKDGEKVGSLNEWLIDGEKKREIKFSIKQSYDEINYQYFYPLLIQTIYQSYFHKAQIPVN